MKKLLKILLILFLFLACYFIYIITDNEEIKYVAIGNNSDFNNYVIKNMKKNVNYNDLYTSDDYRIMDLVNIIMYNEEKDVSIHYLLKNADILTICVGMNELYSKLGNDTRNIYAYLNEMVYDMGKLLSNISRYQYDKVFVCGYYDVDEKNNDIFTYINYKLRNLVTDYGYIFLDLDNILDRNDLENGGNYILNDNGFEKMGKIILAYNKKS
jgi:hypothetical protein